MNAFLYEGSFPNNKKQAFVKPNFNKGDSEKPKKNRTISFISALSKTLEKILGE